MTFVSNAIALFLFVAVLVGEDVGYIREAGARDKVDIPVPKPPTKTIKKPAPKPPGPTAEEIRQKREREDRLSAERVKFDTMKNIEKRLDELIDLPDQERITKARALRMELGRKVTSWGEQPEDLEWMNGLLRKLRPLTK